MQMKISRETTGRIIIFAIGSLLCIISALTPVKNSFMTGSCLLIAYVVATAVFEKEFFGAAAGLVFGLMLDCFSGTVIAFNAIMLMLFGVAAGLLSRLFFNKSFRSALILTFAGSFFYYLLFSILFRLSDGFDGMLFYLRSRGIRSALISFLFIIPFYYLLKLINYCFGKDGNRRCRKKNTIIE